MLLASLSLTSLGRMQFFTDIAGEVGGEVEDWIAPLVVLGAMVVLSYFARVLLRSAWFARTRGRWKYLSRFAPSIASLVYVVGLRLFVELAPISERISGWLNDIIYIFAVILVLNLLRKLTMLALELSSGSTSADSPGESAALQQGFLPLARNLTTILVLFAGVILVLKHFNYDVFSLLTALGVGSLAVGLAAQPTLSNMISGFTLIIDRNLRTGDRVSVGNTIGAVEEIGLRSTRIRTGEGNTLIVPNSDMVNSKILNLSVPTREVSCSTQIRVAYSVSFARVRELALGLVASLKQVPTVGHEPTVLLTNLAEGCQLITIGFWVDDPGATTAVISELNEKLLASLRDNGIALVGPQPLDLRPTT